MAIIVCSCAEMSLVGDSGTFADKHLPQVVDESPLADGTPGPNLQLPREIYGGRTVDMDFAANRGSENAQDETPPTKAGAWTEPKQPLAGTP